MYKVPLMRPSLPDKEEYKKIIDEIWETRMLSNFSKYSQLMESTSKDYFKTKRSILSVSSCDIGLNLLIRSFNFKRGSEVIVPSFTFNSTPNNIVLNNLRPVFVDADPDTFNIDCSKIEESITDRTVAILAVHIFGNPCDVKELQRIASKHNLKLLFDSAHAFGSESYEKPICEYGDGGVFSFSGTKLITSGEGGLAYIKDPDIAAKFKYLRQYGFVDDYNTKYLGMNGKISEFHSALAYLSIKGIDETIRRRDTIGYRYYTEIKGCKFQKFNENDTSTHKDFAILVDDRDAVAGYLEKKGIQTKQYFFPNHRTEYYKDKNIVLENTDKIYNHIICLPIFNDITEEQIDYVISSVNEAI